MDLLTAPTSRMVKTDSTFAIFAGTNLLGTYATWKLAACFLGSFRADHGTARIVEMPTYEYERLA